MAKQSDAIAVGIFKGALLIILLLAVAGAIHAWAEDTGGDTLFPPPTKDYWRSREALAKQRELERVNDPEAQRAHLAAIIAAENEQIRRQNAR
jgi:hypothetical protein